MTKIGAVAVPQATDFPMFDDLLAALAERPHVHLVKVDDQGIVEPMRKDRAFVMQPMVRVVATALDYKGPEILRFQKKWEVGSGAVSIDVFSGRGAYVDGTGTKTRDQIIAAIEARGLQASKGEWTPESAAAALAVVNV